MQTPLVGGGIARVYMQVESRGERRRWKLMHTARCDRDRDHVSKSRAKGDAKWHGIPISFRCFLSSFGSQSQRGCSQWLPVRCSRPDICTRCASFRLLPPIIGGRSTIIVYIIETIINTCSFSILVKLISCTADISFPIYAVHRDEHYEIQEMSILFHSTYRNRPITFNLLLFGI